jgi:uncharacterized protein (TIGR00251 family)
MRRRAGRRAAAARDVRSRARRRAARPRRGGELSAAELRVRLQPRGRRDEVVGERDGAVVIRVTAPPVDGKANAALCRFVARAAGVAPSRVCVVRGHTARDKVVRVEGADVAALRAALLAGGRG